MGRAFMGERLPITLRIPMPLVPVLEAAAQRMGMSLNEAILVMIREFLVSSATPEAAAVLARCGCGASYTRETWEGLGQIPPQHVPADDEGPGQILDLRNCRVCGSTISVEVRP